MIVNVYDRFTKIGSGNFQPITRAGYKTFLGKNKVYANATLKTPGINLIDL